MAIWDQQGGGMDPTQMLLLASMAQGLGRSASRSTNPVWGAPQQQSDGIDQLLPALLQMQQLRAGIANQQADNELQRQQFGLAQQKFAEEQRQSDQRAQMIQQAAKDMGVPVSVAMANPDAVTSAWADRLKAHALTPAQRLYAGGQLLAENPALLEMHDGFTFSPRTGSATPNPEMLKAAIAKATAGSTRLSVDARNIETGQTAMNNIAQEERKKMTEQVAALRDQSSSASEMAQAAIEMPEAFGPYAGVTENELQTKAAIGPVFGATLTPDETRFLSIRDRTKELNLAAGIAKVQKLAPISNVEIAKGEDAAIGPKSPIPRIVRESFRLDAMSKYADSRMRAWDATQAQMIENGTYSPARHATAMQEWDKANPFPMETYLAELKALSQKFPVGAGKAQTIKTPPPAGSASSVVDEARSYLRGP